MARNEKLRIVLDTNVILNALSPKLPYRHLLRRAVQGEFEWCVTTEILFEYEEKIIEFFSVETANALLEALLMSNHVKKVEVFYRFNILSDLDDNKFLDCAFAANAHFLVSDDRIFKNLANISFPKINIMQLKEFSVLIEQK